MPTSEPISTDPCTGEALWRGPPGDVDQTVSAARAAERDWAPLTGLRAETAR